MGKVSWKCKECGFLNVEEHAPIVQKCFVCEETFESAESLKITLTHNDFREEL